MFNILYIHIIYIFGIICYQRHYSKCVESIKYRTAILFYFFIIIKFNIKCTIFTIILVRLNY